MRYFLFALMFFACFTETFWSTTNTDYLEYADIKNTDTINFNWQVDGKSYQVYVDDSKLFQIEWKDSKLFYCYKIVWTWYTLKLGEIYFQYADKWAYACEDNKLRWFFKIGAGGRGQMEDLYWNHRSLKQEDELHDNTYHHAGKTRLEWIWFANWENTTNKQNVRNIFSKKLKVTSESSWWKIADGQDQANFNISLTYDWQIEQDSWGKKLKNVELDKLEFISNPTSDVLENWKKKTWYKYFWDKKTNSNWKISGKMTSLRGGNWVWALQIKLGSTNIVKTWNVTFLPPFETKFELKDKEIPWKTLIWYENQWKIKIENQSSNIENLNTNWIKTELNLGENANKFKIEKWKNLNIQSDWAPILLKYEAFYPSDELSISYKMQWDYSFRKDWKTYKIDWFDDSSNSQSMYKYWKIDKIQINNTTNLAKADWISSLDYKVKFLDKFGFPIDNMEFDLNTQDSECYFDLNQSSASCEKGYDFKKTENDWVWTVSIRSFVPTQNAFLKWTLKNIKYNWHYPTQSSEKSQTFDNLNFEEIVKTNFEEKILTANKDDSINIDFSKNTDEIIEEPKYIFRGQLTTEWVCDECKITQGEILSGSSWTKKFNIYIEWTHKLKALTYRWFVSYKIAGKNVILKKNKTYSPIIRISGWKLFVIWNISSNKAISWDFNYITTNLQPYMFQNQMKKYVIIWNRWRNKKKISNNNAVDLGNLSSKTTFYECENWKRINIFWNYAWEKEIIAIWCDVNIVWDITNTDKWNLKIFIYKNNNALNFLDSNWWESRWNIYISDIVKTIQSSLFTNGSIITYAWDLRWDNIFTSRNSLSFRKQLYINWKIFAKNTAWWGIVDIDWNYTLLWWKKFAREDLVFGYDADLAAQAFDMRFWRDSLLNAAWKYSTWNLSSLILNKYNCTWDKTLDESELCYSSIIVEDDNLR